ncbi:hypothetical protein BZM27_28040 [Paraburkholderia steynii]|uniref:Uncharacterized protein n=1 Tax=Paraburkholderia steynii TaxID=1245441 RepID=A0A4R0XGN8_9BURK|nr:hypothetical protein BZM27_28040 [Paraburkholderia steynii]
MRAGWLDHIGTCVSAVSQRGAGAGFGDVIQRGLNAVSVVLAGMLASGCFWLGGPSKNSED